MCWVQIPLWCMDGEIMGKPADRADASRMLHALQGRSHQVYTGVALDAVRQGVYTVQQLTCSGQTRLSIRWRTPGRWKAVWTTGEPFGKAGAYGRSRTVSANVIEETGRKLLKHGGGCSTGKTLSGDVCGDRDWRERCQMMAGSSRRTYEKGAKTDDLQSSDF